MEREKERQTDRPTERDGVCVGGGGGASMKKLEIARHADREKEMRLRVGFYL